MALKGKIGARQYPGRPRYLWIYEEVAPGSTLGKLPVWAILKDSCLAPLNFVDKIFFQIASAGV